MEPSMASMVTGRLGWVLRLTAAGGALLLTLASPAPAQRSEDDVKIPTAGNVWESHVRTRLDSLGALRSRALRRALEQYRTTGSADLRRDVAVTWGEFVSGTGETFLAVALDRPADGELEPGRDVVVFGELLDASGKVLAGFEVEDRVELAAGRVLVDTSLPLSPGVARALLGIAVRGEPLWLVEEGLDPRPVDLAEFGLSRALLSLDVRALAEPQRPDDPFCFGGMRVTPHGERAFRPTDEPWLFVVVRAPAGDDGAPPGLSAELLVQAVAGGTPIKYPILGAAPTRLHGFPGQWGLGVQLPLRSLPPGDYEASLHVSRRGSLESATATATTTFRVEAEAAGS